MCLLIGKNLNTLVALCEHSIDITKICIFNLIKIEVKDTFILISGDNWTCKRTERGF